MKKIYLWIGVLGVGAILLVIGFASKTPESSPYPSVSPSPSLTVTTSPSAVVTPAGFIGPTGLKAPANCTVAGEVNYTGKNVYASTADTKIIWQNVDSSGRLIKWRVEPKDNLSIGPNLFANLAVPSGNWGITVGLPANPIAKEYKLFASITYGQLIKGNVEVKEVACRGTVNVRLTF